MSRKNTIVICFFILVLATPVLAYTYKFGLGFWESSSEWSDLGGYIGGVYAPILTLLTLLVLSVQIYIQVAQHKQTLIAHKEQQLKEYISELVLELNVENTEGVSLRDFLNISFRDKTKDDIEAFDANEIMTLNQNHHKLYSMWCGVIGCLQAIKNLSSQKNYETGHYLSQRNRVIAFLNPQVCRTLDKYNFALSYNLQKFGLFSITTELQFEFWNIENGT